jgi:hypothetical protein
MGPLSPYGSRLRDVATIRKVRKVRKVRKDGKDGPGTSGHA